MKTVQKYYNDIHTQQFFTFSGAALKYINGTVIYKKKKIESQQKFLDEQTLILLL